jgi:predicted enzyme related to lactoylglutathione lyase
LPLTRSPSIEERTMGEVASYPVGTFSWVDLGTTDVAGAKAFYGGLFGWQLEDMTSSQGTYTMCRLEGRDVAGMHEHAPGDGSGWDSSISVDDVDRATARARELGATVLKEPVDMLGAGRKAVVQDPSGAVVSLWQPGGHDGAGLVNEVGTWTWNELTTPDLAAAKAFYAELFGWGTQDIPGPFPRTSFSLGDLLVGGGHAPAPQEPPTPRWTISFRVADADQSAARAEELGGTVLLPPMEVPVGRFAIVADPAGASFSIAAVPGGPLRGVDGS